MKLTELQRSGTRRAVYSTNLADESGNANYELSIVGAPKLVGSVFEKSDFAVHINVEVTKDAYEKRSKQFFSKHVQPESLGHPPVDTVADLVGQKLPAASASKDTLIVYLRRIKGDGTLWQMFFPALVLPPGASIFFVLPRVWVTHGMVVPLVGNPDIFLSLGAPFTPAISVGTGGGINSAWFVGPPVPWAQFSPWYRVFGAAPTPSVTNFLMTGHSIPWL